MKKYISGFITGVLLCLSLTAFAAAPGIRSAVFTDAITIEVDGVKQSVEVVSVVKEGQVDARNYVSVGDLVPAMGGEVKWIGERNTVEINTKSIPDTGGVSDEWLTVREFVNIYGFWAQGDMDKVVIYEPNTTNEIITIYPKDPNSKIRVKVEDERIYINTHDLIKEGIINP